MPSEELPIVKLYGGPSAGKRVQLRHPDIAFLTDGDDGHYARVQGGDYFTMYWHEGPWPIAVKQHGRWVLVEKYSPEVHHDTR